MITVRLELDEHERLVACTASGHAGIGQKGQDIVCAAVSILLRTTVLMLHSVELELHTEKRGFLSFRVVQYGENESARLCYAAEFLSIGFYSLQKEYPKAVVCERIPG